MTPVKELTVNQFGEGALWLKGRTQNSKGLCMKAEPDADRRTDRFHLRRDWIVTENVTVEVFRQNQKANFILFSFLIGSRLLHFSHNSVTNFHQINILIGRNSLSHFRSQSGHPMFITLHWLGPMYFLLVFLHSIILISEAGSRTLQRKEK